MASPSTSSELTNRALLGRVWREQLKARWPEFALGVAAAAVTAGVTAWILAMLRPAIDGLLVERSSDLWAIPLTIAALALLRVGAALVQARIVNRLGHGLVGRLQVQLFARMVRADLATLRSQHSGAYVSSVLFDANLIREAFTQGVINWAQHALTIVALLIGMLWIDPLLTLLVALAMPVVGEVMKRFSRRTRKAAEGAMAETASLSTALMESLDGVKIVKIENREAAEEARVAEVVERRQRHVIAGATARSSAAPVTEFVSTLLVAAVFAYGGWRAQTGELTVGEFATFFGMLLAAGQSVRQLANLQTVMSEGLTAARRLFAALDVEPEIADREGAQPLERGACDIRLEDVTFAYHPGAPALSGVTIEARPGETVALVGPSGGGKSTILNLIPRFYEAQSGRVTINGSDVRDLTVASLRDSIALVTQEPFLFDDTIRANIAYSRPDASDAEIVAAAEAAAAHDFVLNLPAGYETQVGEAGARLSGGQRQRIAIARAFLKDAPILLLDEATSALDAESEAKVQAALERLMHGRTTLMIAHRLATVQNADRIYVIEAGRVVEQGRHKTLIGKRGLYARLAQGQSLDEATAS
jgi:subfamily B ATP-binding cassette protein MsbA